MLWHPAPLQTAAQNLVEVAQLRIFSKETVVSEVVSAISRTRGGGGEGISHWLSKFVRLRFVGLSSMFQNSVRIVWRSELDE